jgi:thioredoxin-related protein
MAVEIDFDIDKAVKDANSSNKHIMIFIHKDNCGYCERMYLSLDDKDIEKAIKKDFILLDVNRDDDEMVSYQGFKGTNREFIKALDIDFFPTLVFINAKKDTIVHFVAGYRNKKKFLTILDYISSSAYTKKSLEDFKDERFFNE